MSSLLITNAHLAGYHPVSPQRPLTGDALDKLYELEQAYLLVRDGLINAIGPMSELPSYSGESLDAAGRYVLPAWCDSHTHLVFAATREQEFEMRLHGASYEEIAAAGGGILNSARKLQDMPEDELYELSLQRFRQVQQLGTGAIEIKSGYGLSPAAEIKMLRVIRRLRELDEIPVKATFLGAHAIPAEYKYDRTGYLDLMLDQVLPQIAAEGLADYIDVFCDRGFFTPEEAVRIMQAGQQYGLRAKIHANELAVSGGVEAGVQMDALSVDHLEQMDDAAITALSNSATIGTMLPGCAFFLGLDYPRARDMIAAGAKLALATDYNPGTAPSGNMNLVHSLACIKMKMTPAEAFNAATVNGAFAMELNEIAGTITPGKQANLLIMKPAASFSFFAYNFGLPAIDQVIIRGRVL